MRVLFVFVALLCMAGCISCELIDTLMLDDFTADQTQLLVSFGNRDHTQTNEVRVTDDDPSIIIGDVRGLKVESYACYDLGYSTIEVSDGSLKFYVQTSTRDCDARGYVAWGYPVFAPLRLLLADSKNADSFHLVIRSTMAGSAYFTAYVGQNKAGKAYHLKLQASSTDQDYYIPFKTFNQEFLDNFSGFTIEFTSDNHGTVFVKSFAASGPETIFSTPLPSPPGPSPPSSPSSPSCSLNLYTGGSQCTPVTEGECFTCSTNLFDQSMLVNCTTDVSPNADCQCQQYIFSNPDCTGTMVLGQVQDGTCTSFNGTFPQDSVCVALSNAVVDYRVNLYSSEVGKCEEVSHNSTCIPCTASGLTSYYTPVCDTTRDGVPCKLDVYPDSSCASAPVQVAMNELSYKELSRQFRGVDVCAFSYEPK